MAPRCFILWWSLALALAACGAGESRLAIRVHHAANPPASIPALRDFDPANPPARVQALVARASDPHGTPVAWVDLAWDDLETDPGMPNSRFLLIGVPSNSGQNDPYLLRLASLIEDPNTHDLFVDACGAIGRIETLPGQKTLIDLQVHPGDCKMICSGDNDCVGSRFCLSFECQDNLSCSAPEDCPGGAYCRANNCSAACTPADNPCPESVVCCGAICSVHCP